MPPDAAMMLFRSTRRPEPALHFSEALRQGLAADGGLFIPQRWPTLDWQSWSEDLSLASVARQLLAPFAAGDVLAAQLPALTTEAFNFPAPLVPVTSDGALQVLQLYHGPTAAFKDFGARFLAAAFQRLRRPGERTVKILVATSGDTGGAVAAAFHRRAGLEVAVLFPDGKVSPLQQHQLTCWGDNVQSFSVDGSFDDCQRLVKQAFMDAELTQRFALSSANSINLGRLLPQAVYYAATSIALWRRTQRKANFIIPSGNLGNSVACVWARQLGLPIGAIVLAHNANRTVPDFLDSGSWAPRASVATLASAMDVGNPSNIERLMALYPDAATMRRSLSAFSVDDPAIAARIRSDFETYGQIWCPHTATAAEVYTRLSAALRVTGNWVIVCTAHAAKFAEIVEPLIGRKIDAPPVLQAILARPSRFARIGADLADLREAL